MKKLLALLLTGALAVGMLAGCGSSDSSTEKMDDAAAEDQKLPSVQSLKHEKAQLTERKQAQYESYSALRSQWLELSKLARNRDSIAGQAMLSERNSKKRTI